MNTLEMIKDWKESNCKKKYITKIHGDNLPYTVFNNGLGVLFCSFFTITINDPIKKSKTFVITKDNLDWEWEEIVVEYDIKQAIEKAEKGDSMISLVSGRILNLKDRFTKDEIIGKWIEKF